MIIPSAMFANPPVPPESLPRVADVAWEPLHPSYARRLQAGVLARTLILAAIGTAAHRMLLAAVSAASTPWQLFIVWGVFGVWSALSLLWPRISVPRCGYSVRRRDILYRSGVLWRKVRAVPFNRVQHITTGSTPLDRRFGLASLTVSPAGGGAHKIRGLDRATAEALAAYVSSRIDAGSGNGEAQADGDDSGRASADFESPERHAAPS